MADVRKEEQEQKRQKKAEIKQKKANNLARHAPNVLHDKKRPSRPKPKPARSHQMPMDFKRMCRFGKYTAVFTTQTFKEAENKIKNRYSFRGHLDRENEAFLIRLRNAFDEFSDREDANVRNMLENDSPEIRERTLWEMFQLAPSNPANEVLPSAVALKEEKIQYLKELW